MITMSFYFEKLGHGELYKEISGQDEQDCYNKAHNICAKYQSEDPMNHYEYGVL